MRSASGTPKLGDAMTINYIRGSNEYEIHSIYVYPFTDLMAKQRKKKRKKKKKIKRKKIGNIFGKLTHSRTSCSCSTGTCSISKCATPQLPMVSFSPRANTFWLLQSMV